MEIKSREYDSVSIFAVNGYVDVLNIQPEDFTKKRLARALSNKCRFGGFTKEYYSVAQHCVLVSTLCEPEHRLAALLHELDEVFLPDIPSPVKHHIFEESLHGLAEQHTAAGLAAFGLNREDSKHPAVKKADQIALCIEAYNFVDEELSDVLSRIYDVDFLRIKLTPLPPELAYEKFLTTLAQQLRKRS